MGRPDGPPSGILGRNPSAARRPVPVAMRLVKGRIVLAARMLRAGGTYSPRLRYGTGARLPPNPGRRIQGSFGRSSVALARPAAPPSEMLAAEFQSCASPDPSRGELVKGGPSGRRRGRMIPARSCRCARVYREIFTGGSRAGWKSATPASWGARSRSSSFRSTGGTRPQRFQRPAGQSPDALRSTGPPLPVCDRPHR